MGGTSDEAPHPLAQTLGELLHRTPSATPRFVLVLGAGSGRNIAPLLRAGVHVDLIEEDAARAKAVGTRFAGEPHLSVMRDVYTNLGRYHRAYAAVLSTHALLHGSAEQLRAVLCALAEIVAPDADLFLTFGSTRDPRFGHGTPAGPHAWAAAHGSEAGVPHTYFEESELRTLLRAFDVISLEETAAGALVGRWAHDANQTDIVHWFAHLKASEF
ncbi:MAG TPA: class I SAM-dependent methyltransferase [Candidatus Acidoferrales bacterium]|nr:class I SAM-dependent methyltransferase [Candidatus Acidoferrales bacterium]